MYHTTNPWSICMYIFLDKHAFRKFGCWGLVTHRPGPAHRSYEQWIHWNFKMWKAPELKMMRRDDTYNVCSNYEYTNERLHIQIPTRFHHLHHNYFECHLQLLSKYYRLTWFVQNTTWSDLLIKSSNNQDILLRARRLLIMIKIIIISII